ncbi:MAG: hypothetical protein RIQ94_2774 [Pseudomonadota bacterium]|jgi:hypothetical protein
MLQAIKVHIEPIKKLPMGRALLTLSETTEIENNPKQSFDNLLGILTANHSVSLKEIEQTLAQQAQESIDDRHRK